MPKVRFPKHITVGAFKVELVKIPHAVAYDSSDYQGSFVSQPPAKIFLDEDIIDGGGMDAVNLVLHELCHLGFYQYSMKEKPIDVLTVSRNRKNHRMIKNKANL